MVLTYQVYGAVPLLPRPASGVRADDLWKATCFELFLRGWNGEGYVEFNFSPSSRWAAYGFDAYRDGMRKLPMRTTPMIEASEPENGAAFTLRADLDWFGVDGQTFQTNLAAVIEERDGTKSFWALAHSAGKPDFHDPACFVLELPAAKGS